MESSKLARKRVIAAGPPGSKKFAAKRNGSVFEPTDDSAALKKKKRVSFDVNATVSPGTLSENAVNYKESAKKRRRYDGDESNSNSTENKTLKSNFRTGKNVEQKLSSLSRKDRKIYLQKLKAKKKPNYELSLKAKRIWENLRNTKLDKDVKKKLMIELHSLVAGKAKELIYAHDTVRVFQCLMALKNEEIRTKLFEELKVRKCLGDLPDLSEKEMQLRTPSQRLNIMERFYGHAPELMKHAVASDVLEYAYNEYANALQRSRIASEFYGADYKIFKVTEPISLKDIIEREPHKKDIIFKTLHDHLLDMTNKPVMRHSLSHHLVMEFFENFPIEKHSDLIDSLKDYTMEMVHTKRGVLAAMHCLWFGPVKTRKTIVKGLKGLVTKVCLEEHGHLFLLAIFDTVDDTALVGKIVLQEIAKNLKQILANKYGVKVLQYLLSPRDSRHFNKQIVDCLAVGDSETTSKKPRNVKYAELLSAISPELIEHASQNVREMLFDPHSCLLFGLICEKATGDKQVLYQCLCDVLMDEFIPCNSESFHAIEHVNSHFVLKHLIKGDQLLHSNGHTTFSEVLVERIDESQLSSWLACNRGAFLLLYLLETKIPSVCDKILAVVEKSKKRLKKYTFPAAKLLLKLC